MTPSETVRFLQSIACTEIYVVLPVAIESAEEELRHVKDCGYAAFLRHTAIGTEIVVTDAYSEEVLRVQARLKEILQG